MKHITLEEVLAAKKKYDLKIQRGGFFAPNWKYPNQRICCPIGCLIVNDLGRVPFEHEQTYRIEKFRDQYDNHYFHGFWRGFDHTPNNIEIEEFKLGYSHGHQMYQQLLEMGELND